MRGAGWMTWLAKAGEVQRMNGVVEFLWTLVAAAAAAAAAAVNILEDPRKYSPPAKPPRLLLYLPPLLHPQISDDLLKNLQPPLSRQRHWQGRGGESGTCARKYFNTQKRYCC